MCMLASVCVILFKITVKMSSSSILKSPGERELKERAQGESSRESSRRELKERAQGESPRRELKE